TTKIVVVCLFPSFLFNCSTSPAVSGSKSSDRTAPFYRLAHRNNTLLLLSVEFVKGGDWLLELVEGTMGSSFNAQILVEKLSKLNNSQASIETLSHWCIFHMNKAKHVVETWGRQFHCSPREQRLAYLYLANDILQNSRRKGSEFVGEFWKVLPDALRDVIENGDDFGRKAARRLVNIWEERKVFGSHGQILKEEILGKQPENGARNGALVPLKLKQANGIPLERVVSSVEALHGVQIGENVIVGKCTSAAGYLERATQEVEKDLSSGHTPGPALVKEVQGQHAILRDCIEQLGAVETSRISLISHLREALQEQELKLEQVRNHLQIARFQSDRTGDLCKQLLDHGSSSRPPATEESKEVIKVSPAASAPQSFTHIEVEQSAPVMFASNPPTQSAVDPRKTAAAAVVARLTASTSSAEMLSHVLSSLASEGIIGNNPPAVTGTPSSDEYPPEKRPKLQNHDQSYLQQLQQQNAATTSTSPLLLPPPPPPPPLYQLQPQYLQPLQPPGPVNQTPFNYTIATTSAPTQQQQGQWVPGLTPLPTTSAPSDNSYQKFQGQDRFYGINPSVSMAPVTRQ
uniref:CID domain-containing protein n=2 Tax=Brassica oleracea var. oleracea TaxID=109376 RepID=A0A0D3DB51_BRAOL